MSVFNLDITGERCPMTFVKVKLQLAQLQPGDTLEVLLAGGEPLENVPRTAAEQGFTIVSNEPAGAGIFRVVIRK